jgi:2-oxoisovalerate dehydrogenase E2 component (dihydrolipoyl transacylase)
MKIFNLPDLGEGLAEAEIVRWHVKPGDRVDTDQPMLAVETAKAVVEVPSPYSGTIKATHGNPGDMIATGALLVEFEAAGNQRGADSGTVVGSMPTSDEDFVEVQSYNSAASAGGGGNGASSGHTRADHPRAVPAARALARKLGIDLAQIRGTGRGELITVDDVVNMSAAARIDGATAVGVDGRATHAALADGASPGANLTPDSEKLRGPRRSMAQSMALSRDSVMPCTLFDDADLHDWLPSQDITTRLLRAIAGACVAEPALNAWFDGTAQTRRVLAHVDVAIAVDTPEGLIVPVIRNIGGRPIAELRQDVDRLKRSTRDRTVAPEELRDFTFMLSNFGMLAGRYATPVVVPPAVAILGSGRLSLDVVALEGGEIEAHRRMPLSLTFDHRCVTGGEAARFMAALIRDLQKGS